MLVRNTFTAWFLCGILAITAAQAAYSQSGADQPREKIAVCKINGETITEADLMEEIDRFLASKGGQIPPQLKANAYVYFYEDSMNRIKQMTLLEQKAKELKLEASQEEVDEFIDGIKEQAQSEENFKAMLAQRGTTEKEVRAEYARNLVMQKVLESNVKEAEEPTDEACKTFYEENPQHFEVPEQVKASHILLLANEETSDEDRAKAKEQMADIRKKIEAGEVTFADAAKEYSKCPSAPKGGDLDWFGRGQMVKPFEEAAFSMKKGDMSQIIETQFGYHLIQVVDRKEESKRTLEEVKPQIAAYLKNVETQNSVQAYMESLEKEAEIETVMTEETWTKRHSPKEQPKLKLTPDELK